MLHISLAAEKLFSFLGFGVTNSFLMTVLVSLLLVAFSLRITKKVSLVPNRGQNALEIIFEVFLNLVETVASKKAQKFFPLVFTFFLFIVLGNWSGLIPGVGSFGFWKTEDHQIILVPFLRGATADLNTTLALALFSVGAIQYFGLTLLKRTYLLRFFNFQNPALFLVGLLELISDLAKVISFAFRLFGNIFAGEVLLIVMAFLIPLFIPLPFLGLEIFIGFIQAFIFALLTLVFLNVATAGHGEEVEHAR